VDTVIAQARALSPSYHHQLDDVNYPHLMTMCLALALTFFLSVFFSLLFVWSCSSFFSVRKKRKINGGALVLHKLSRIKQSTTLKASESHYIAPKPIAAIHVKMGEPFFWARSHPPVSFGMYFFFFLLLLLLGSYCSFFFFFFISLYLFCPFVSTLPEASTMASTPIA
jgi:hypothetical protein